MTKTELLNEMLEHRELRILFHKGIQDAVFNFLHMNKKEIMDTLCEEFRKSLHLGGNNENN